MTSPHPVLCQKQCTCWSIGAFRRCLKLFLFPSSIHPFIHHSYVLFFSVAWVLSSPTSGAILESLPNCEVLVTNHHCFRPAYRTWVFIDTGQWRPANYKFVSVYHCSPDRFLHKPVFGIEDYVFPGFSFSVSLWFPLWTHHLVHESYQSDSGDCHFKEFRAASFEIYSLPVRLRIQFWTFVRGWINTCWTMRDRLVIDVWMCLMYLSAMYREHCYLVWSDKGMPSYALWNPAQAYKTQWSAAPAVCPHNGAGHCTALLLHSVFLK